ncbi:MAG TPA: LamG domain-containing protein [Steroidobacteraceae bacterium]|jgi:hypothetical protein
MRRLLALLLVASPLFGGWSACYKLQGNGLGTTNFPITLSTANNAQMAAIMGQFAQAPSGLVTSTSGYDIIISTDPACDISGKVPFERAIWSASLVQLFYLGTTNGTYYLGIGNSAITTDQSDPTTLWGSASAARVWHTPNGSTLASPSPESTSNADSGTLHSTPTASASPVGGAATFNGTNQYLSFTGLTFSQPFSIFAWINPTSIASDTSFLGGGNGSLGFRVDTAGKPYVTRTNAADDSRSTVAISTNTWTRVAFIQDGTAHCTYYINGSAAGSYSGSSCQTAFAANTTTIGTGFTATRFFPGSVAEVYILGTNPSADWAADDYASQEPSSTFITVSAVVTSTAMSQSNIF